MTNTQMTGTSLRVSRVLKAPREKVYRAWLDGESPEMKRFAPNQAPGKPMRAVLHRLEPRVGAAYRVSMIADEGPYQGTYTAYGTSFELVPDERIVQTHAWEGDDGGEEPGHDTKVTITFRDVPGGTEAMILHEGSPGKEAAQRHAEG